MAGVIRDYDDSYFEIVGKVLKLKNTLLGRPSSSTAPNDGDVPVWNAATQQWEPEASGGSASVADVLQALRVRAATTANLSLSGTPTIDGVVLNLGDRVLVKNQSTGSQNGVYVVQAGAWGRASDADSALELVPGRHVTVSEGTLYADTVWTLTTNSPIVVDTTALTFSDVLVTKQGAQTLTGAKTFATVVRVGSAFTNYVADGTERLILASDGCLAFDQNNDGLLKIASWFDYALTLGDATNTEELLVTSGGHLKLEAGAAARVSIWTAGSERVRVDANGALLLGSTAVAATSLGAHLGLGPQGTALTRNNANNAWLNVFAFTANDDCTLSDANVRDLDVRCSRFLKLTVGTERARLNDDGLLMVGTTSTGPEASAGIALANNLSLYGEGSAGGWSNLIKINADDATEVGHDDAPTVIRSDNGTLTVDGHLEVDEVAEPAAPAANKARLFAVDNGAGKTRLMVRFPTGASVELAIEP
jgi:hypothetical protein